MMLELARSCFIQFYAICRYEANAWARTIGVSVYKMVTIRYPGESCLAEQYSFLKNPNHDSYDSLLLLVYTSSFNGLMPLKEQVGL
jgi:hypothetical protein